MLVCIHSVLCSSVVKGKKSIPGFTNMSRQFVSSVGIHLQTVRDDHEWQRLQCKCNHMDKFFSNFCVEYATALQ